MAAVTVRADQLTNAGTNNFPGAGLLLGHPFGPPRYLLSPMMCFRTHPGGQRVPRQDCPQPFATTCDVLEGRIPIVLPAADLQNVKTYRITPVEG